MDIHGRATGGIAGACGWNCGAVRVEQRAESRGGSGWNAAEIAEGIHGSCGGTYVQNTDRTRGSLADGMRMKPRMFVDELMSP